MRDHSEDGFRSEGSGHSPHRRREAEAWLTELLTGKVKPRRMSVVIRRPETRFGGRSWLDVAVEGRRDEVEAAVNEAFDIGREQP